jgi:hypothetical protein
LIKIELASEVTDILVAACKSGELLLIAHSLNAFYDIFSEATYNLALQAKEVVPMMQAGLTHLQQLVSVSLQLILIIVQASQRGKEVFQERAEVCK